LDWANFFYLCGLIAIPGLLMLVVLKDYQTHSEQKS